MILGGALVLATAMEVGGFESIEVTEAGLREGVFFERLLGERELFEDVRAESVQNLAHRFEHHREHDQHVWTLSRSMFDGLASADCTTSAPPSASCSGPPACCTTSAWP